MSRLRFFRRLAAVAITLCPISPGIGKIPEAVQPTVSHLALDSVPDKDEATSPLPVPTSKPLFIQNLGQWPDPIRFQMRQGNQTWWFTDEGVWVSVVQGTRGTEGTRGTQGTQGTCDSVPLEGAFSTFSPCPLVPLSSKGVTLRLTFPGLSPSAHLVPLDPQPTHTNYFHGSDPSHWHANVPTFGALRWENLYPGVDLVVRDRWSVVRTDPLTTNHYPLTTAHSPLHLHVTGADSLRVDETGWLVAETAIGVIALPLSAEIDGNTVSLSSPHSSDLQPSTFSLHPSDAPSGLLASSFPPHTLVYSTLLGGSGYDNGYGALVGPDGTIYVIGDSTSSNFPTTTGTFDTSFNGINDVVITRLSADGSQIDFSTYLGGSADERGRDVTIAPDGAIVVAGQTSSTDFPTTAGAFDSSYNGPVMDAFAVKLSSAGDALLYGTYLGGSLNDEGRAVEVDGAGSIYVAGYSQSTDFPTTPGAFLTTYQGGTNDAFVSKFTPDGHSLAYSTYLGGSNYDAVFGLKVDSAGDAYVVGNVSSVDFPVTANAFDPTYNGPAESGGDIFVSRLNAEGSGLVYSTYFGGRQDDQGDELVLGPDGTMHFVGMTTSANFPTTPDAFDTTYNGSGDSIGDAYVAALRSDGSGLVYSTYLGGSESDRGWGIALSSRGLIYVTGTTSSSDFPVTANAFDQTPNDIFVATLTPQGRALVYGSYFGGSDADSVWFATPGPADSVYISGSTSSRDFPTTPGAFDRTPNGSYDSFVARFRVAGGIMHVARIDPFYARVRDHSYVGAYFTIQDQQGTPVSGANIRALMDWPDGRVGTLQVQTDLNGQARVVYPTDLSGTYTVTVTNVSLIGWTYDPSQNTETTDEVTIP